MITVMFSSRNGAGHLGQVMDGFAALSAPKGGWKLIAVDNGSSDGTGDVMRSYADRLPLTVITEPAPGKNRALNRALELAEGDFYVFTDDDVIVPSDWLVKWRDAAGALPEYDLFAGSTKLLWSSDPPKWQFGPEHFSIVFGSNEHMAEGPCDPICMFGTNMAIRAPVFTSGNRFSGEIGPDGSKLYPMGSETELALRLKRLGYKCWFAAGAQLQHIVRPTQMDILYIINRGYRWGRGQGLMKRAHRYMLPEALSRKNFLRWAAYPFLMPFYNESEAWSRQWEWVTDQGYEDGWRESQRLTPRWSRSGKGPHIAARFRQSAV